MALIQSWRWFGPNDPISLEQVKQTGATGIVTALHDIPYGEVWPVDRIKERKNFIEKYGFKWVVIESVPVHEDIKTRTGDFNKYIENYKKTLKNISESGIEVVCYNFMPAIDWSRTRLTKKLPDGSFVSELNINAIRAFELFILGQKDNEKNYSDEQIKQAEKYFKSLSNSEIEELQKVVLLSLPGLSEPVSMEYLKKQIEKYKNISREQLKEHLKLFIKEIVPVAEEYGIRMAIHPDDPPIPVLGLPRIVGSIDDLIEIVSYYDSLANGITLCTGSLGAGFNNDCTDIASSLAKYIHFAHLRNVQVDKDGNFSETYLFEGRVNIPAIMKILINEEERRKNEGRKDYQIPLRPDHGNLILGDIDKNYYPGYSLYGRLKNLAELRGLEMGIRFGNNIL